MGAPRNMKTALQNAHECSAISIRHMKDLPTGRQLGTNQLIILSSKLELKQVMQKEVLPTTRKSYQQAAQLLGRAFVDDPVSVAVYRNFSADRRGRALTVDFTAGVKLCVLKGYPLQADGV